MSDLSLNRQIAHIHGSSMNKAELTKIIQQKQPNVSATKIGEIVNQVFGFITTALKSGEDVNIVDFGKFTVRTRAERQGRNPKTGEAITIPERKTVTFRPSKRVNDSL